MSTIGSRIRARRQELGMTADDLADALGKNRATIYRYENDDIENLPMPLIEPLSRVLRVSPEYLMGWDDAQLAHKQAASIIMQTIQDNSKKILKTINYKDSAAIPVNLENIQRIASGEPYTWNMLVAAADDLGVSVYELVLDEDAKKKTALEFKDGLDAEVYEILNALSPEKLEAAKTYLRFLKSQE